MSKETFDDLWAEFKANRVRGTKTEAEVIRKYERYVRPLLGKKQVAKTTFRDIDKLHRDLGHAPVQANRVLALLAVMYKYAAALQIVPSGYNPARDVKAYPERKRRRHMMVTEAPKIAMEIRRREPYQPAAALFLWLLIFTGARSGEIKAAHWRDLKGNVITLSSHKTSDKTGTDRVIVLPPAAMEKLELLAPEEIRHPDRPIIDVRHPRFVWFSVRKSAGCPDLRVHDLRHTFGTYALEKGYSLDQIGEALNHTNPQTTKIYAELTTRSRHRIAADVSLGILADMMVVDEDLIEDNPLV